MEISNNCRRVRKTEEEEDNRDMDLMPRSYQIIRQYPHLSRHATFKGDNEADTPDLIPTGGGGGWECVWLSVLCLDKTVNELK